jgi:WD40 repeat protein
MCPKTSKLVSFEVSDDETIKVWDLNTGRLLNTLEGHSSGVSSVAISSDNSKIVSVAKYYNRDYSYSTICK